jgi:hypothetical protein
MGGKINEKAPGVTMMMRSMTTFLHRPDQAFSVCVSVCVSERERRDETRSSLSPHCAGTAHNNLDADKWPLACRKNIFFIK